MSYNIDSWETIDCTLTMPEAVLDSLVYSDRRGLVEDLLWKKPLPDGSIPFLVELSPEQGACGGVLKDGIARFVQFAISGEGSGHDFHELVEGFTSKTAGRLDAVLVWEGGDSISRFTVEDGVATHENIDIAALLEENAELKYDLAVIRAGNG